MSSQNKLGFGILIGLLFAGASLAQTIGVGASIGLVNDISDEFHWDEFRSRDLSAWVDYEVQHKVFFRGTLGSLRMKGVNAGKVVTPPFDTTSITLPDLENKVNYGTIGVSYEFAEQGFTSGIFAGIGGYTIRPYDVDESIANYRDPRETVFGWHFGGWRRAARQTPDARDSPHLPQHPIVHAPRAADGERRIRLPVLVRPPAVYFFSSAGTAWGSSVDSFFEERETSVRARVTPLIVRIRCWRKSARAAVETAFTFKRYAYSPAR